MIFTFEAWLKIVFEVRLNKYYSFATQRLYTGRIDGRKDGQKQRKYRRKHDERIAGCVDGWANGNILL